MKNRAHPSTEFPCTCPTDITAADLAHLTYEERQELIRRLQEEVEAALRQSSLDATVYFVQN